MTKAHTLVLKARDSDAPLAERREAFCELVRIFQDMAYASAYAVLGDFCLAQDAAQEAFLSAWQKLGQLRQPEAFPGWFRRIVLTECNRHARAQRLRTTALEEGIHLQAQDTDLQSEIEKDELKATTLAAIKKLTAKERMVVMLFYVNDHSQSEISAFLNVPLTTVAKRLYSARVRLRAMMMDAFKKELKTHRPSRNSSFAEKVKAGIYDEYVGQYRFELRPELVVTIKREGERLIGEAAGQRNELFASGAAEAELLTREFDGRGEFVRNKEGHISHLVYYESGNKMGVAKKIG